MIKELAFTENQRFQFGRFEAGYKLLWAMQKRSKKKMLIFNKSILHS